MARWCTCRLEAKMDTQSQLEKLLAGVSFKMISIERCSPFRNAVLIDFLPPPVIETPLLQQHFIKFDMCFHVHLRGTENIRYQKIH